jgi:hypothetical protein
MSLFFCLVLQITDQMLDRIKLFFDLHLIHRDISSVRALNPIYVSLETVVLVLQPASLDFVLFNLFRCI